MSAEEGVEARLRAVEDRLAVADLVASYGPLVDAGDGAGAAALWTADGTYDVDTGVYEGAAGIAAMVASPAHQGLLARGCAHVTGAPRVTVTGDTAIAVCHSLLVVRRADGRAYDVLRATAHRFELVRTADGWRIHRRTGRLLDGSESARSLLRASPEGTP